MITFIILVTMATVTKGQLEWMSITYRGGVIPPARRDAALGYYQSNSSNLIMFGGRNNTPLHDTWIFDIDSGQWTDVTKAKYPPARFSMVYGLSGRAFYVAMGEGKSRVFLNDVWRFDVRTYEWTELRAQPRPDYVSGYTLQSDLRKMYRPKPRYGAAGGIYPGGSKLFVHQGFSDVRYFDTHVYDTNLEQWNIVDCKEGTCNPYNPSYPHARCLHAGAMVDKESFVIFGGCLTGGQTGGACPSGDTWLFNSKELKWTEFHACLVPRIYGSMAMLPVHEGRRRVVLYGGIEELPQVIQMVKYLHSGRLSSPFETDGMQTLKAVFHLLENFPNNHKCLDAIITTLSTPDVVGVLDLETNMWSVRATTKNPSYPALRASAAMVTGSAGIYMFGGYDIKRASSLNDLWLLVGDSHAADGATIIKCPTSFTNFILVHGCLMVIGWGVFILWGLFIARYFRSSGTVWFYLHISLQVIGTACSIGGFVMAVMSVQFDHFQFTHGIIGLTIFILGFLQPINAIFRPKRPEPDAKKPLLKVIWEFIHHFGGRCAVLLALANISLGMFVAVTHYAVWYIWFVYLGIAVLIFIITQFVKDCAEDRRRRAEFQNPDLQNSIHNYQPRITQNEKPPIQN